nr:Rrf2 family transcriptional regulator [Sinobaca sp. H24]
MKTGVEQAACILAMISTQEEHKLVSSDVISSKLKVSSSYLKKMLRKLVVHELIVSVPGNQGGFG